MARIYEARTVRSMLRDHERSIRQQAMVSKLARTGLSVPDAQVTAVDGDLQAESFVHGSAGWRMQAGGNAEFNDITIRGAAVGIDAPVLIQTVRSAAANFSLSTTFAEKCSVDVTVPDGCTRLRSAIFGRLYAVNPNASGGADGTGTDALYISVGISGVDDSTATPTGISGNGGFATTNGFDSFSPNGLTPGATVHLRASGCSGYASMAANANNYISLVATLTWLR
jgi:hypothetical protein